MAFHMLGDVFHRYTGGRFPKLEFGNVAGHLETASAGSAGEVAAAEAAKMGMKELKTTIPECAHLRFGTVPGCCKLPY